MARIKQIGMAAGTFSVALGIGFIMQNGDALANRFGADTSGDRPAPFSDIADVEVVASEPERVEPIPVQDEVAVVPEQAGFTFANAPITSASAPVTSEIAPEVSKPADIIEANFDLPTPTEEPAQQDAPVQLVTVEADAEPTVDVEPVGPAFFEAMTAETEAVETAPAEIATVEPEIVEDVPVETAVIEPTVVEDAAAEIAVVEPTVVEDAPIEAAIVEPAAVQPEIIEPDAPIEVAATDLTGIECVPSMAATLAAAAMVTLDVDAPCHISEAFTIHHQGMLFTAMTDENGDAEITVPALAEVAVMIAAFGNGDGAVTTTTVSDFASFDRAVLQWQGDQSVMLSAYEGDARFGDDKHIFAGNPGDISRLQTAEGGFLVRLGDASVDNGLVAEIYTFPSKTMGDAHNVMLVAEAEITFENCGQELAAQSIQVSPTGETSALDLTLTMPNCDAVGDVLILQKMFEDLTIAMR